MQKQLAHCVFLAEHRCIIVAIQSAPTDDELTALSEHTARLLARDRPRSAVLDLTGLDVADSFSVQSLQRLCTIFHLYSVNMVIAGIQAEVAFSMALRGLGLNDVLVAVDLTDALALLEQLAGTRWTGSNKEVRHRLLQNHKPRRLSTR